MDYILNSQSFSPLTLKIWILKTIPALCFQIIQERCLTGWRGPLYWESSLQSFIPLDFLELFCAHRSCYLISMYCNCNIYNTLQFQVNIFMSVCCNRRGADDFFYYWSAEQSFRVSALACNVAKWQDRFLMKINNLTIALLHFWESFYNRQFYTTYFCYLGRSHKLEKDLKKKILIFKWLNLTNLW